MVLTHVTLRLNSNLPTSVAVPVNRIILYELSLLTSYSTVAVYWYWSYLIFHEFGRSDYLNFCIHFILDMYVSLHVYMCWALGLSVIKVHSWSSPSTWYWCSMALYLMDFTCTYHTLLVLSPSLPPFSLSMFHLLALSTTSSSVLHLHIYGGLSLPWLLFDFLFVRLCKYVIFSSWQLWDHGNNIDEVGLVICFWNA